MMKKKRRRRIGVLDSSWCLHMGAEAPLSPSVGVCKWVTKLTEDSGEVLEVRGKDQCPRING